MINQFLVDNEKRLKVKVFKSLRMFCIKVTNTKVHKSKKDHDLNYIQLQLPTFMRSGYIIIPHAKNTVIQSYPSIYRNTKVLIEY